MPEKPEGTAWGLQPYISNKSLMLMLQLLFNTSGKADSLNGNTSAITGFFYMHAWMMIMISRG